MRAIIQITLPLLLCAAMLRADERVLKFPAERAIGALYVRDKESQRSIWGDWRCIGPAQGEVHVPSGKAIRLDPAHEGINDLSALTALKPDDLDMVYSAANERGVDLASIAQLTGLRVLVLRSTTLSDEQLSSLGKVSGLRVLALGGSPINDSQLHYLEPLPNLRQLELGHTKITGDGLKSLAKIASLEELELDVTDIGDKAMPNLLPLIHLRRLSVENTDVGDEGVAALASMPSLESLNITETPVTDKGLAQLSKTHLKELFLQPFNTMSDAGMEHVGKITTLERLWLPSNITDIGVGHLASLRLLRDIYLPGDLTDVGIAELSKLTALENVTVRGDAITDAGFSRLAALPHLKELHGGNLGPITLKKLAESGTGIEALALNGKNIAPEDLKELVKFPHLKRVYPINMDLRGEKIDGIAAVKTIEFIQMFDVQVDDGSAARLGTMPALKELLLPARPQPQITNVGVKSLSAAKQLQHLDLFGKGFNDETLAVIGTMTNMHTLQTYGEFTDAGLAHLEGMPALEGLYISVKNFTPRAIDRFRQTTPSLQRFDTKVGKPRPKVSLKVADAAPDFEVKTFDGKTITLKDLAGKVVILHFWATWCAPCMASTEYVKQMNEELSSDPRFAMISISLDDTDYPPQRHAERHQLSWPQAAVGLRGKIADDYGIEGVATLVVIGPDGKILARGSYDEARAAAKKALQSITH